MSNDSPFSDRLVRWASIGGFTWLLYWDGVWSLGNRSDLQDFLHIDEGMFRLTRSERNGPERMLISSQSMADVELYLTVRYGGNYRSCRDMPFIYSAYKVEDLKPGWKVDPSLRLWKLYEPSGTLRACFHDDDAVWFSWIADASVGDLEATYMDPEGLPLAPGLWIGPPRGGFAGAIGYTLGKHTLRDSVPVGWDVEVSKLSPGFGRPSEVKQMWVCDDLGEVVRVGELVRRGVLR